MLMESQRLNELLERYWNCETTLEEEQELRAYFRRGDVPEQWKDIAALFRYFDSQQEKTITDASFDQRLKEKLKAQRGAKTRYLYNAMRIAAGVAVLVVATWFVRHEIRKSTSQEIVDTYNDPKLAFEETKKALLMISKSFGMAEEQAKKINMFNQAQEEIQNENKKKSDKL